MNTDSSQFKNVLDFNASKVIKERTGQTKAVRVTTPDSPELIKHENEAMALGNPVPKKKSLIDKATAPISRFLGFEE